MSDKIVKTDKNIMVEGKSLDSYVNGDKIYFTNAFWIFFIRGYIND